jgi:carbonic anhydrase/acetyltransferase-like protein (isoleucine patch superfamily)
VPGQDKRFSAYADKVPVVRVGAWVDVSARLLGDVLVEEEASVWPMAVLRADSQSIRVEKRAAVLDLALVEAPQGYPVIIGQEAIVSHGAKVHGATLEPLCLVGIGAIVLDGAVICTGSIVGAGAVVPPRAVIPPNSLVLGVPGKVVRQTTEQERRSILTQVEELLAKSRVYGLQGGRSAHTAAE